MKYTRVALLLFASIWLSSCRLLQFNFAGHKATEQKQTLFDHLIALAPNQQVPYPFAELLAYLALKIN